MKTDAMWQAFSQTGDPVFYLLHKAAEDKKPPKPDIKETPNKAPHTS